MSNKQLQRFIGRTRELETLRVCCKHAEGQLVLLTGRRRIGKTYLLERFLLDRSASRTPRASVFYQATRKTETTELEMLAAAVSEVVGGLPPGYRFAGWSDALEATRRRPR